MTEHKINVPHQRLRSAVHRFPRLRRSPRADLEVRIGAHAHDADARTAEEAPISRVRRDHIA